MRRISTKHRFILESLIGFIAFFFFCTMVISASLIAIIASYSVLNDYTDLLILFNIDKIFLGVTIILTGFYIFVKAHYQIDDGYVRYSKNRSIRLDIMSSSKKYRNIILKQYMLITFIIMIIIFMILDTLFFNNVKSFSFYTFDMIFYAIYTAILIKCLYDTIQKIKKIDDQFSKIFRIDESNNEM